jgi:anti-anti-sigma regulatory factor
VLDRFVATHEFHLCTGPDMTTIARRHLTLSEHENGVIALSGELDLDSSAYLAARIAEWSGDGDLVVLTAGLDFADISGCRALLRAAEALGPGRRLVLPDPSPPLAHVLDLCDWSASGRLTVA